MTQVNVFYFDRSRFEAGEMPTRTRDGRKVLWCADTGLDIERPIVALLAGGNLPTGYTKDGLVLTRGGETPFDLVHEPKTRKMRIAVCRCPFNNGATITMTSDAGIVGGFDTFVTSVRKNGRLLHLLEVDVPV